MEALDSAPGVLGGETPVDAGPRRVPLGNADVEEPCQAALVAVAQAQAGLSEWPDACAYHWTNVPNNDRGAIMTPPHSGVFDEVELTHHWTLQPPLADYRNIHRSISRCSWCGSSPNEDYAGNSPLRRDERTGGPTAMEGWNPAVPRSPAEYATGADTQPGMAFIAAGAPPRDIQWPATLVQDDCRLRDPSGGADPGSQGHGQPG